MRIKSHPKFNHNTATYHNFNYIASSMRKKEAHADCLFHLQNSLIGYSEIISAEEKKSIGRELTKLLMMIIENSYNEVMEKWSRE